MAKRFTDTNKYKKKFFRGLQGAYKLLWDFLYHDCDHTGIWIVDFDIAQLYIGADMPVNYSDAIKFFNDDEIRIVEIDGGKKWFVPMFIEFQYGSLSTNNKAHGTIISALKKHDLIDEKLNLKKKVKGHSSPLEGAKYKDTDKGNGIGIRNGEGKGEGTGEPKKNDVSMPFNGTFELQWGEWKKYKKEQHAFTYKNAGSEQAALHELVSLAYGKEDIAIAIIHQSMANGWKGLFQIKNNSNGQSGKQPTGAGVDTLSALEKIDRMYNKNGNG